MELCPLQSDIVINVFFDYIDVVSKLTTCWGQPSFCIFWLKSFYKASVKASQPKNVVKFFNDNSEDFSMVMDVTMLMYMVLVENIS